MNIIDDRKALENLAIDNLFHALQQRAFRGELGRAGLNRESTDSV